MPLQLLPNQNPGNHGLSSILPKPCCGLVTLNVGAKFIAITLMAMSLYNMTLSVFYFFRGIKTTVGDISPTDESERNLNYLVVFCLTSLFFSLHVTLYYGIKNEKYKIVNICWIIVCVKAVVLVMSIVYLVSRANIMLEISETGILIFHLYSVWVIYVFKEELNRGADLRVEGFQSFA